MSHFIVSARKYRPAKFDEVMGQDHVAKTLKNALRTDHLAHAFLFCGPRGVGKTTTARILAKTINCDNMKEAYEPCSACPSCKSFDENASFNIIEIDAASHNSVDNMRSLVEQIRYTPPTGGYKVYIIDEVHMLSSSAFNAFLKTLEEPPAHAIFILATTEKHKILPTILSRCQVFDFKRIQVQDIVAQLRLICASEEIDCEEDALILIGQKADGALRDALSIFDRIRSLSGKQLKYQDVIENLNLLDYDYYFRITDAILQEDATGVMQLFDEILKNGFEGETLVGGLAAHFRDLLMCKDPNTVDLLDHGQNLKTRYADQSGLLSYGKLLSFLNLANDCDVQLYRAQNKRLHIEILLAKLCFFNRMHIAEMGDSTQHPEKKKLSVKEAAGTQKPVAKSKEINPNADDKTELVGSIPASENKLKDPSDTEIKQEPNKENDLEDPLEESVPEAAQDVPLDVQEDVEVEQNVPLDVQEDVEVDQNVPLDVQEDAEVDQEVAEDVQEDAKDAQNNEEIDAQEVPVKEEEKPADTKISALEKINQAEKSFIKPVVHTPKLGSLMNIESQVIEEEAKAKSKRKELSDEELTKFWAEYTDQIQSPSVKSTLILAKPAIQDGRVSIAVGTQTARTRILEENDLVESLRNHFAQDGVELHVWVDDSMSTFEKDLKKPKKLLTNKEKYLLLADKNPLLRDLKNTLDLVVDQER